MKKLQLFLLLVFSLLLIISCKQNKQELPHYYKKAVINRDNTIDLHYPLSDSCAVKTSCYFVEYSNDSITRLVFLEFGKPKNETLGINNSACFYGPVSEMRIERSIDFERRTFYNENGKRAPYFKVYAQRLKIVDGKYSRVYNYDENDIITENFNNVAQYDLTYTYKPFNYEFTYYDSKDVTLKWDNAIIMSRKFFDRQGNWCQDRNGNIMDILIENPITNETVSLYYSPEETEKTTTIYYYSKDDKFGNCIEQFDIDDKSHKIKSAYFGSMFLWASQVQKYNSNGNLVEKKFLDANGNLIKGSFKNRILIHLTKYKYDINTNLIEEQYFGRDEQLVTEGVAVKKYLRDSRGRLIEKQYFDYKGIPSEQTDGQN